MLSAKCEQLNMQDKNEKNNSNIIYPNNSNIINPNNNSNIITITANNIVSNYNLVFPSNIGISGQSLGLSSIVGNTGYLEFQNN